MCFTDLWIPEAADGRMVEGLRIGAAKPDTLLLDSQPDRQTTSVVKKMTSLVTDKMVDCTLLFNLVIVGTPTPPGLFLHHRTT